ncbi:hypothetical protein [Paenibacillus paridis]|uniref:hypothetical protein n=1 Tax=Paenibacillus paridis TaxID=2583376 RepID=UPI0011217675|nr:hypothetical protein [Paenibacillus paridis]
MLLLKAEIIFLESGLSHDISTKIINRPGINLGNNLIFSGTITPIDNIEKFIRGNWYEVNIEMPNVENEAYQNISPFIVTGNTLTIQTGARKIGLGKIIDYLYYI